MKKYSFSSVDNTRKRYAFSSYQHPKATHTYLFEAELKRVIQANQKFYHFENKQVAKRYNFTVHLNYVKRYDFEMKLIQFENGRIRKYDFIATKPHKRYDFTSKRFKREARYHFESWYNDVFSAEITSIETLNKRAIFKAEIIQHESCYEESITYAAIVMKRDAISLKNKPQQANKQTNEVIKNVKKMYIASKNIASLVTRMLIPSNIQRIDEAYIIKVLDKAEIITMQSKKIQKEIIPSVVQKPSKILVLKDCHLATQRMYCISKNIRKSDSTSIIRSDNLAHLELAARVIKTSISLDEKYKKVLNASVVCKSKLSLTKESFSATTALIQNFKELPLRADKVVEDSSANMHASSDIIRIDSSKASNGVGGELQYEVFAKDKPLYKAFTVVNEKTSYHKDLAIVEIENTAFKEKKKIVRTGIFSSSALRGISQKVSTDVQKTEVIRELFIHTNKMKTSDIKKSPVCTSLKRTLPIIQRPVDTDLKESNKIKSLPVDTNLFTPIPLNQKEIKTNLIKLNNISEQATAAELVRLEAALCSKFTLKTSVISIDPFKLPNDEDKKPMWLIQSRPRWGARYFTQVRR